MQTVGAGSDYVARARALVPALEAAGPQIDRDRELPPQIVEALHEGGLFRLLVPRTYGGAELDLEAFFTVLETLAGGDASTAWCVAQTAGCSMSAAYLKPEVAREIFGDPRGVLAWGPGPGPTMRAVVAGGGYRATGTWPFGSGSRHATWLGGHSLVYEADGSPKRDPSGEQLFRTMLFPRASAKIRDVWHVSGLRGTGSDTYSVEDLFVPEDYTLARDAPTRYETGTLYRFAIIPLFGVFFAAVALGIARAALDAFVALAREKTPKGGGAALRESQAVQGQVGLAEVRLRAARTFLLASVREAWDAAGATGEQTMEQRVAIRMGATYAIWTARDVVDVAYNAAGATAIFESAPFERRFRDVHAVSQQVQAQPAQIETVGRYLLGLPFATRTV